MSDAARAEVAGSVRSSEFRGWLREHRVWIGSAALLVVLPYLPGLDGNFGRSLLSQMGIAAVFALSYNVLLGQTGLLSFGHAVYFGLGGYAGIHLLRAINGGLPIPVPLVPLAGAATGLLFGIAFGSVTTRRGGVVFALISLGIGELVFAALRLLQGFSGGEEGLTANRSAGPHVLGLAFASQLQIYYVIAAWAFVATTLMYAFTRTPVGRICNAVRDNPERVEFLGYNPVHVRFVALCVAAMFAGLAGGLHAINYEIVAAESVGAGRSAAVLLMVYIGGAANFVGPILGAVTITWLQVSLSDYTAAWQLYLGLFFMAVVLYAHNGLAGLLLMHAPIVRTRGFVVVLKSYALAFIPSLMVVAGAILLIEINYRLSTQPPGTAHLSLFGFDLNLTEPWAWLFALTLVGIGLPLFQRVRPRVLGAWEQAIAEAGMRASVQPPR